MKLLSVIACIIIAVDSNHIESNFKESVNKAFGYMDRIIDELNKIENDVLRTLESKFKLQEIVNKECQTSANENMNIMKDFNAEILDFHLQPPGHVLDFQDIKSNLKATRSTLEDKKNQEYQEDQNCNEHTMEKIIENAEKLLHFIPVFETSVKEFTKLTNLKSLQDLIHAHHSYCWH